MSNEQNQNQKPVIKNQHGDEIKNLTEVNVKFKTEEQRKADLKKLRGISKKKKSKEIKDALYWERPRQGDCKRGIVAGFTVFHYLNDQTGEKEATPTAILTTENEDGTDTIDVIMSQTVAVQKLFRAGIGTLVEIECTGKNKNTILFDVHLLE